MQDEVFDDDIKTRYRQIGLNVKKIREEKGKSQLDLALSIGHSSAGFIGKAEICIHGKHFNIEHLHKIAKVLDVDICEFFNNKNGDEAAFSSPTTQQTE